MRVRVFTLSSIGFLIFLLGGCAPPGIPYLYLDIQTFYSTGSVVIPYEFLSESDEQPCRIRLYDLSLSSHENNQVYSNGDDKMKRQGELAFTLVPGSYKLEFTVLSERFWHVSELSFLSQTVGFSVLGIP